MDRICAFAKEHGLIVVEDAAHAHGAAVKGKKVGAWGDMSITSFQGTKPLPGLEGGAGLYQQREHYERAAVFGDYRAPGQLPEDSPYRQYEGTGLGLKLRIHPVAVTLIRTQLETLDQRNAVIARQVRRLNDALIELPGISEPYCRKDIQRVYYSNNIVFFDESKAGFPRKKLIEALKAEGVRASDGDYPEQHKLAVYSQAKWWHHQPDVPRVLPGTERVNEVAVNLALFREEVPELVDQYIAAFRKIWSRRDSLA
jgi:dTDP-4-amino-4,6-dideoxygalactose transaminase